MKKLIFAVSLLSSAVASAAIHTETVTYKHGNATLKGYLAYDDASTAKRPGVLVAPEWWGVTDHMKKQAERLAGLGYVAFVADIYGNGQVTADPTEASKLSGIYKGDRNLMRGRTDAALRTLHDQKFVDDNKIALIGYCFGGTCVLELARGGAKVAGVVTFHGGLDTPTPADAKNIRGKVLVLTGGDDSYVPPTQVTAFEDEMRKGGVDWQLVSYGNAVHGFTNPSAGTDNSKGYAYNEKADRRSWQAMQTFFNEIFPK
jgi:dienelactone hydrolase